MNNYINSYPYPLTYQYPQQVDPYARLQQLEKQQYNPQQYNSQFQQQPQQQIQSPTIWVNGIEGAKAYIVAPNTAVVLMDSDESKFYMKQADANGICNIKAFKFEEITQNNNNNNNLNNNEYVKKEEFDKLKNSFESAVMQLSPLLTNKDEVTNNA